MRSTVIVSPVVRIGTSNTSGDLLTDAVGRAILPDKGSFNVGVRATSHQAGGPSYKLTLEIGAKLLLISTVGDSRKVSSVGRPSEFAAVALCFTYELPVTYTTEIRQHVEGKLRWTLGSHEHVIRTRWVKELSSGEAVLEIKVTCRNEFLNDVHKQIENLLGGKRQDIPSIEPVETLRVGHGLLLQTCTTHQ